MRLVLVLDDNEVDAMQVERALSKARPEARVRKRVSAHEALRLLETTRMIPDLLFVDVQLDPREGIDGFQFVAMARQIMSVPVVLMSGAVNDAMRATAAAMGGVPLMAKPNDKLGWLNKVGIAAAFFWDVVEGGRAPLHSEPYDTESPARSQRITEPPPTPDAATDTDGAEDWE